MYLSEGKYTNERVFFLFQVGAKVCLMYSRGIKGADIEEKVKAGECVGPKLTIKALRKSTKPTMDSAFCTSYPTRRSTSDGVEGLKIESDGFNSRKVSSKSPPSSPLWVIPVYCRARMWQIDGPPHREHQQHTPRLALRTPWLSDKQVRTRLWS